MLTENDGHAMSDDHARPAAESSDFFRELDTQILVHELKSPLALIEATTRTLLAHGSRLGPLTERQDKALNRVLRGAVRGRRLVDHLLEIGRAESAQFAYVAFDPAETVLQTMLDDVESVDGRLAGLLSDTNTDQERLAALAEAGIRLTLGPGAAGVSVVQDRVKFELIVSNLLQNALRYRRQALDVLVQLDGAMLTVTVKDDGPGVPPEHQAAIFERYRQAPVNDGMERKGHGLGLAGALLVARRLGGDITLESVAGNGATFRLTLPHGG